MDLVNLLAFLYNQLQWSYTTKSIVKNAPASWFLPVYSCVLKEHDPFSLVINILVETMIVINLSDCILVKP